MSKLKFWMDNNAVEMKGSLTERPEKETAELYCIK